MGFTISKTKSTLQPSQCIEFLGFSINSTRMEVAVPERKICNIRSDISNILSKSSIIIRVLAEIIGKLMALEAGNRFAPIFL